MEHPQAIESEESRSRSSFRMTALYLRDARRCRFVLAFLSVVIAIGMIISIIFAAHSYFHSWGGQGFLRAREEVLDLNYCDRTLSHLPLREIMVADGKIHGLRDARDYRPRSILPFYFCGDQQNSCEAYSRPNICCPVGMACHSTIYSSSGTYCCTSAGSESECIVSASRPPQCPNNTYECATDIGGGCCPQGSTCSQSGCIEFWGDGPPPPTTSTTTTILTYTTAAKVGAASIGTQMESSELFVTTTATTITIVIGGATTPTATVPKQGAEAQRAQGVSIPMPGWPQIQNLCPLPLLFVTLVMGIVLL